MGVPVVEAAPITAGTRSPRTRPHGRRRRPRGGRIVQGGRRPRGGPRWVEIVGGRGPSPTPSTVVVRRRRGRRAAVARRVVVCVVAAAVVAAVVVVLVVLG